MRARTSARSNAREKSRWLVNRSRPRFAYRILSRWTGGACWSGCSRTIPHPMPRRHSCNVEASLVLAWLTSRRSDDGERQQLLAGRADLDLGVHLRADAAVVARVPPTVV